MLGRFSAAPASASGGLVQREKTRMADVPPALTAVRLGVNQTRCDCSVSIGLIASGLDQQGLMEEGEPLHRPAIVRSPRRISVSHLKARRRLDRAARSPASTRTKLSPGGGRRESVEERADPVTGIAHAHEPPAPVRQRARLVVEARRIAGKLAAASSAMRKGSLRSGTIGAAIRSARSRTRPRSGP